MPIPNLLNKYGIESGAKKTTGVPNLIATKYKDFAPEPTPVTPPAKPGFFSDQRLGGIVKNTITGLPKAAWNFLGPGQIQDYLKTPEGQEAALDLTGGDVVKEIIPAVSKVIAQPVVDVAGIVTGPKTWDLPIAGKTSNIQQQAADKINNGDMGTGRALVEAVPQAIFDVLALYGGFEKLTSPRQAPITRPGLAKFEGIPQTPGPKTGRLYTPTEHLAAVKPEAFTRITTENNIPIRTNFNPENPIVFRLTDGTNGQFFQIKPSYLDTFIKILKGDPTKVPPTQLVPVTNTVAPTDIKAPTISEAPIVPTVPKPVAPTVSPETPVIKPSVPMVEKPVVPPVVPTPPQPVSEQPKLTVQPEVPVDEPLQIKGVNVIRPEQLVTKTQVKDLLKGIGQDSVDFTVEEIDGKKYMTYKDAKNDMRLKPSALGLIEDNIKVGQTVNINAQSLKQTGTGLRAVNDQGVTEASLASDLSESAPASTPSELAKRIEQLNKVGQAYGITRKTGGVKKTASGRFTYGPKVKEPKGKIELREETVKSPQQYMSTLAHELGHAIDFHINGNTKNTLDTFGKNLTSAQREQIIRELKAVTDALVGEEVAMSKPGYYYKPTELLARFLEKMFVSPGDITELAPLATEMFEKAAVKNPIISEFMDAVMSKIDAGELKHIFLRDMRQTYTKQLGTRVGNIAWDHEVNYRSMKERAKIVIEKLVKTELKDIKDDQELLFNAVESIKSYKGDDFEFGTRDFANAQNDKETQALTDNGYEKIVGVNDLVNGKILPRYAKVRYTPEQGKAFFEQLSPEGKQFVKDFTVERSAAKGYFNREVIKDVHKIKSNVEGWMHHYWEDKPFGSVGGKTLKMKSASAAKHRKNVEGYEKNLKDAMIKSLTELNTVESYNKFMEKFFPTVTKPIAEGGVPDEGWVEVFGNIYKGGVATEQAARTLIMKDGKTFVAKKARYQMPKEVYKRFQTLREPAEEANNSMRILNSVMRYWRVNILMHMGSNATNFISGGIQYSAKIVKDFYGEVLSGDITVPKTRSNIFAMLTTLTPKGWQNAPDWIYGGDLSNSYGQFTGETHPGVKMLEDSIDAYADKGLKIYGLFERYWKKVIVNSMNVNGLKDLNMVTKEGLKLPTMEEEAMIAEINKQVDLFGLDYDNVPVWLQQYKRGWAAQALKPFAVFPYKITKLYTTLIEDAFDGTKSWQDRLSSILALGTMIGVFAWAIEERRKKQKTPIVGSNAPSSVSAAGKVYLGTDAEGKEMFTRISKYPFLNIAEAGIQVSNGNIAAAYQVIQDMIGSIGPVGQIVAAFFGYKSEYQQYMTPDVIAGQLLATFVPATRILNDIATYNDPYQRKQQTFLQGLLSFVPITDPNAQEKLRGKIRTIQIPLEAGVGPAGDMPEGTRRTTTDKYIRNYKDDILWQALAGIYIKRIDPQEAEAFNVREEKNLLKKDGATTKNPL